jgi:hypothetical protein
VFAFGLWVCFHIFLFYGSGTGVEILLISLVVVAPGFLVAFGCYLQTVRGKVWGMVLVLFGVACNFGFFLRIGAWFAYGGDTSGLRAVWVDLGLLLVAFVLACIHTLRDFLSLFQPGVSNKAGEK